MTRRALAHPSELLPWLVNGTLEGEELQQVQEHLRSCLTCRREVEELRELRREVKAADARPPGEAGLERLLADVGGEGSLPGRRRGWFRPWMPALAAAALVVAVGVGVWLPKNRQAPVEERAGKEAEVLRSLVDPQDGLPRQAFVLRWQTAAEWREARFSVIVTADDVTPVAEVRGLEATEYEVPAEALAALPAGARLFWRLEAVRPDGTRRVRLFETRLE